MSKQNLVAHKFDEKYFFIFTTMFLLGCKKFARCS